MKPAPLSADELTMVKSVLRKHGEISSAILFGSRAKGTHTERSDVDLALTGALASLDAEAVAADLDQLPLPYRFEVQALQDIQYPPLLDHIRRVGIVIYSGEADKTAPAPTRP